LPKFPIGKVSFARRPVIDLTDSIGTRLAISGGVIT